jgi:hypothetical protein
MGDQMTRAGILWDTYYEAESRALRWKRVVLLVLLMSVVDFVGSFIGGVLAEIANIDRQSNSRLIFGGALILLILVVWISLFFIVFRFGYSQRQRVWAHAGIVWVAFSLLQFIELWFDKAPVAILEKIILLAFVFVVGTALGQSLRLARNGEQKLNPWVSIWVAPRATIQQIVNRDPDRSVLLLAAVAGLPGVTAYSNPGSPFTYFIDSLGWVGNLLVVAVIASFVGIVGLYIASALLGWTGNYIDGEGSVRKIRAAVAWSTVPIIWSRLLWIPAVIFLGEDLFLGKVPTLNNEPLMIFIWLCLVAAEGLVSVWGFVVSLHCLGQVQGFSAWKAFLNLLLASLFIFVPYLITASCANLIR